MEQLLICLSTALIAGLLMSRLAKAVHLPAVTSYLLAGLLLGPFFLGRLGLSGFGIGFGTLEQVDSLSLITQVALGMAAEAAELSDGHMVRNVVLFSVLVYELVGPTLTKLALTAAGEIIPEGRTSRPHRQQARSSGVPRLSFPRTIKRHSEALRSAFSFVLYFRTTSPFSASTVRLPPAFRVPSMMRSAAGSSTALRMTRRRSRAPNLPP